MRKTLAYLWLLILFSLEASNTHGREKGKKSKGRNALTADTPFEVNGRCAAKRLGSTSYSGSVTIPARNLVNTYPVYEIQPGYYRVSGRTVHMDYLKKQLEDKRVSFDASRTAALTDVLVEVHADTVYIQGQVQLFGIRILRIFARVIIGEAGSELDLSAPTWSEEIYRNPIPPGGNGENGRDGFNGPTVKVVAYEIRGAFRIKTNGGDGLRGQDGGDGLNGLDNNDKEADRTDENCKTMTEVPLCGTIPGIPGITGPAGEDGGSSGRGGNGGDSGMLTVLVTRVEGNVELRSCGGSGAPPGTNGRGGRGGLGSHSGDGAVCAYYDPDEGDWESSFNVKFPAECLKEYQVADNTRGPRGSSGRSGNTPNTPGRDGSLINVPAIHSGTLGSPTMESYPISLLRIMRRGAEHLILENDLITATKVLNFLILATADREDATDMNKDAKRRLGFLGKEGYDLFGNNKLFAPRIKWEILKKIVENMRIAAKAYENAYNEIAEILFVNDENFQQVASHLSEVTRKQVETQKQRLMEARRVAVTEKELYVRGIGELESRMNDILRNIEPIARRAVESAQFNADDFMAVVQAMVGFATAAVTQNPVLLVSSTVGLAQSMSGKLCPVGPLDDVLASLEKWLTFGERYSALRDSSDLDFDQLDVDSVPEVMEANLEMNKEELATQLVCLFEVASRAQDVAHLKTKVEQFFSYGAARIDLIGKVLDLDNEIGGYNYDVPLLEETEQSLLDVSEQTGGALTEAMQEAFMEKLFNVYGEMEDTFMKHIHQLYKALQFRTLWDIQNPLEGFQRSQLVDGQLQGVVHLTQVLRKIQRLHVKAVECYTNNIYTTGVQRWNFDSQSHPTIFHELTSNGFTTFSINLTGSCTSCYNVRLLKLYIEFGGDEQPHNVPDAISLQIRHLSESYFRDGNGNIKEYRQSLGNNRTINFRRYAIIDEARCREEEINGELNSLFCMKENDGRWRSMCSHPLSGEVCANEQLASEECRSPFGTYELTVPVDENLDCDHARFSNKNCRDLDLTRFNKMHVWAQFYYWSKVYPAGPDDGNCLIPLPAENLMRQGQERI